MARRHWKVEQTTEWAAYLQRPVVIDLFCGAGGAAKGYYDAGYRVIGVDTDRLMLKRYPFESVQGDAITFLKSLLLGAPVINGVTVADVVMFHASPPCQAYSKTQRIRSNDHPELIDAVRTLLISLGKPYVIENVMDALTELRAPIMLCGEMFPAYGLRTYRHRLFETSFHVPQPTHPAHTHRQAKMGRPVKSWEFMHVVGNFSDVESARKAMGGLYWMGRDQLKEAIPPAYTNYVVGFLPEP